VSIDQLIAKLQKLSAQVEKGMSKQGFTVWIAMIREDLFKISNAEVRKGALKMLGVVECAGFCLDRAPEARETLILPNLKPLVEYLKDNIRKTAPAAPPPNVVVLPPITPVAQVVPAVPLQAEESLNPS
jgi:hypothetical protein